jgi:hypothetical protein
MKKGLFLFEEGKYENERKTMKKLTLFMMKQRTLPGKRMSPISVRPMAV